MSRFVLRDNQAVICPYCGSKDGDAWERQREDGVDTCDDCGKKFKWRREVQAEYITEGDCELNGDAHDWKDSDNWITNDTNPNEEFRIRDCKNCAEYEVDRRPKAIKVSKICKCGDSTDNENGMCNTCKILEVEHEGL